jgi:A/G-specific adenine glycosylase
MIANTASRLLLHYRQHARDLPWRAPPGAPRMDPYRVWLSEVMLQQTTVATVAPRFLRFVERWPTVQALAEANDEDVLHEWAGLGYYARARNLIACARVVVAMGGFPQSEAELRKLPGIGEYTAAAIAAIAFGQHAVAVDTNVERVVARLHGLDRPVATARAQIRGWATELIPVADAGDFTQAMMDLGATICRPKQPRCDLCPLQAGCAAFASGTPERFPPKLAKPKRPERYGTAWWIEQRGAVWLVRRPAKGIFGGMPALPGTPWTDEPQQGGMATVTHIFTHLSLRLTIAERTEPVGEGWWQPIGSLNDAGLPSLYARAVGAALASRDERRAA